MRTATFVLVMCIAGVVHADPAKPPPAQPPAQLSGRISSSSSGLPIAGVSVFVSTIGGLEQEVTTDDLGQYHATLHRTSGPYDLIFAFGTSRSSRHFELDPHTDIHLDARLDDTGEVITIHDATHREPVPAKPLADPRILPPYTDRVALGNYWAKAWLLLDVDDTGAVTRLKVLKHPGYDLEAIAIEIGMKLRFEPARDSHGTARRSYMIWPVEWPSYEWVIMWEGVATFMPWAVKTHQCLGDGPLNLDSKNMVLRDCSWPDLDKAKTEPWVTRGR